jgi:hypothetical protein
VIERLYNTSPCMLEEPGVHVTEADRSQLRRKCRRLFNNLGDGCRYSGENFQTAARGTACERSRW